VVDALGGAGARRKDITRLFAQRAPVVVVLDPFDRLVPHASLLSEWLRGTPALSFVAVSRQVLRVPEEVVLEVPAITDEASAIALFAAIAERHRPGFTLGEADRAAAAAIVHELDGLPLAIELAASRMTVMSPQALLHRLRSHLQTKGRFEVLRRGGGDGARHHALEASIAWSIDLLGTPARETLAQCTVFRGGFTIEAAEAVVQLAGANTDVLDLLRNEEPSPIALMDAAEDFRVLNRLEYLMVVVAQLRRRLSQAAGKLREEGCFAACRARARAAHGVARIVPSAPRTAQRP
jgi:predicted ATPase